MKITRDALQFRAAHAELLANGSYEPVNVSGIHRERCVAFRRKLGNDEILVSVPRLSVPLGFPPLGKVWDDTRLNCVNGCHRNIFTGANVERLDLATVFAEFPVALLVKEG
jgi:(1->4)-alpha-D-glucan 1-alpha-D-glucosylmutase